MREISWNWQPPNASAEARKEWEKPWTSRVRDVLRPTQETFARMLVSMIESFTTRELYEATTQGFDMVDAFITVGKLRHPFVRPWARLAIQQNAYYAYRYLVGWAGPPGQPPIDGPAAIVRDVAKHDPVKAQILSTQDGWTWLQIQCYHLAIFFREFAKLDRPPHNWPVPPPPPGCPVYSIPKMEELLKLPQGQPSPPR